MKTYFGDILNKISEPPTWFDRWGIPRYQPFAPDRMAAVDGEAALLHIVCQNCGTDFKAAVTYEEGARKPFATLASEIEDGTIGYGDPPDINCCVPGPTMNSITVRVLEYWVKRSSGWERLRYLETVIREDMQNLLP